MNDSLRMPAGRIDFLRSLARNLAWGAAAHLGLAGLYGGELENHWFLLERRRMAIPRLPRSLRGMKIAHLSDLHFSPLMRERHLARYFHVVNALEADFVVLTGDFITASARHYARRAGHVLRELAPKRAILACLGNHDYGMWHPTMHSAVRGLGGYVGDKLREAGAIVLENDSWSVGEPGERLHFVGTADVWSGEYDPPAAFDGVAADEPIVGLCHNPDAGFDLAARGADWVLSGHTHGKAVADNAISNLLFPVEHRHFTAGEYPLGDGRFLYVNRGLGHARRNVPNYRPEITLFTLEAA
jgi:hypothetical protein